MRKLKVLVTALVLVGLCAGVALAAEQATEKSSAAATHDVAVFSVPKPAKGDVLKDLAKALADKPGIVAAKADKKNRTFSVTFDREKTNGDDVLKAVTSVSSDAQLVSVGPADPNAAKKAGCGGCPRARSCPGTTK